jgi:alkyl hydroperoxide reductase subunit F
MPKELDYDLIIIGAGPAGMTAGVYAARKQLRTLILSRDIGGQAAWSSDVENYPGFSMVSGADLVNKFHEHLEQFKDSVKLQLVTKGVHSIQKVGTHFLVNYGESDKVTTASIIIAGGKVPRELGIKGEKEYLNRGVTYSAKRDELKGERKKLQGKIIGLHSLETRWDNYNTYINKKQALRKEKSVLEEMGEVKPWTPQLEEERSKKSDDYAALYAQLNDCWWTRRIDWWW